MAKKLSTGLRVQLALIGVLILVVLSLIASQISTPDAPISFGLKRIQEKAFLKLKSNPQEKLDYMRGLLDTRLGELESQVNRKSYGYILPSALRYSTLAGQITEMVSENNLKSQINPIKEQFAKHSRKLKEIYDTYPKNTDNVEYKYIEDDINYLKIYLEKLAP